MKVRIFPALLMLLGALQVTCTRVDGQEEFEAEAFRPVSGFTRTSAIGQIQHNDEDDWRISPLYQQLVFLTPAYPNPTSGQNVTLEVSLPAGTSLIRIDIFVISDNLPRRFITSVEVSNTSFFEVISINPRWFSLTSSLNDVRGLNRLLLYDARGRLISYGDIMVE
jgi:hypothetical protein